MTKEISCMECVVGRFKDDLCEEKICKRFSRKGSSEDFEEMLLKEDRPTGWIPVAERLPENSGRYIVTLKDIWAITVRVAVYGVMPQDTHNKKVFWLYDSCCDDLDITEDVTAWMPLPKPYREDGEA